MKLISPHLNHMTNKVFKKCQYSPSRTIRFSSTQIKDAGIAICHSRGCFSIPQSPEGDRRGWISVEDTRDLESMIKSASYAASSTAQELQGSALSPVIRMRSLRTGASSRLDHGFQILSKTVKTYSNMSETITCAITRQIIRIQKVYLAWGIQ